ncbi:MAG: ATP-dependent helicase, RecQ-like protein [Thermoleophilia bacterium]|nr:ATP-dependent helicase, RecQ-like protein [Thermoleophilia bacterium]
MTTDDNDMRLWPAPGETATIPGRTASSIAAATARTGPELRARGEELLRTSLGPDAAFRDGQWDAIELLVTGRARLLVVQRTGWGKSSVYFITTRLLREQGAGPTVLVSPLLALMRDQIRAAERLGVKAARIDSTNMEEWGSVVEGLASGETDLLLVSPERLANGNFQKRVLQPLLNDIGLFVVDEAHCISDWGHDFRPDYRRIKGLLPKLGADAAVLATTATANEAVARDVVHQLGGEGHEVVELRGPLSRASLQLQATHLPTEHERMAWLAQYLPTIDGSGIVYVLTKAHASRVAAFLRAQGIAAEHYTGGGAPGGKEEDRKLEVERRLLANELKVVVATPALGMGFDKPDLAFVVHLQMPQSLIHYYQQVGRAGRATDAAYGVLLHGEGDRRITDYFIAQAFPPGGVFDSILESLHSAYPIGMTVPALSKHSKVGRALCDKVLGQLAVEDVPPVEKRGSTWYATMAPFTLDTARFDELTRRRHAEYARILDYARGGECLMVRIASELDDPTAEACGRCSVCTGAPVIPESVDPALVLAASEFKVTATRKPRRKRPPKTTARVKRARRKKP